MKGRAFETVIGFIVLICTMYFFFYSYNRAAWKEISGYSITATFDNAEGISQGSLVKVSGVKVGIVNNVSIDKKTYLAKVAMTIDGNIQLPKDTEAAITTEGLLGGKYIALSPGFEETKLAENDEIIQTRGAQNLETLINKFLLKPSDSSATSVPKTSGDNGDNYTTGLGENNSKSDGSVCKTSGDNGDSCAADLDENNSKSDGSVCKTSSNDADSCTADLNGNNSKSGGSVCKTSSDDGDNHITGLSDAKDVI